MSTMKAGLNRHQKAAFRPGEQRVGREEIDDLLAMSRSDDPEERAVAARYLCPCHVRRRIDTVWDALFRMLEDPEPVVRRAAWHTLEDGGRPDDPALDAILERAVETETDAQVRRFVDMFAGTRRQRQDMALRVAHLSEFTDRGKCDFCGGSGKRVKKDLDTKISANGCSRPALICKPCSDTQRGLSV